MPAGFFNDRLILVTNDGRSKQVPLRVEGNVVPSLSVSPASLFMGVVKPGTKVKKVLVIRGKTPFKIKQVSCGDGCFEFQPSQESKLVHLVPVVFTAPTPGKITRHISIETEEGRTATCTVTAKVEANSDEADAA